MKTDDPSLEKRRQEMFERVGKMNALTLAVLRSHLLAEQCMGDYIIKQKFSAKMERCKKLAKDEGDGELWGGVLNAANQLRNTIAHTLSPEKITEKMSQLKPPVGRCARDGRRIVLVEGRLQRSVPAPASLLSCRLDHARSRCPAA
jgi:recombination DNA repair RAD52 pathway protein